MNLLHLSVSYNNWEGFKTLLRIENSLEVWKSDLDGNNVIHLACNAIDTKFVDTLCLEGIFSSRYLNSTNVKGQSCLHCLCTVDSEQWIEKVINRPGINIELPCKEGNTPFIASVLSDNLKLCEILHGKGVNINHQNKKGFSALHYACINNFHDGVLQLITWKAKINVKNQYGLTPLCFAVIKDNRKIVRLLLKNNADLKIKDRNCWSVLHHAVKRDNISILQDLLVEIGTTRYRKKNCLNPLFMACSFRNLEAVKVLLPYQSQKGVLLAYNCAKKTNATEIIETIRIHAKVFFNFSIIANDTV